MSVAKLRLGDFLKEENHRAEANKATIQGKMTFGDAVVICRQQLQHSQHLKPSAKLYREKCISALLNEDVQIISAEKYHACAKEAMNREVFPAELSDRESLKHEFVARVSKATLLQLNEKARTKTTETT
jgi:hypothetical protein